MGFWQTLLVAIGGNAVLILALGWLLRSLGKHYLDKDLETYKNDLTSAASANIEELKSRLQITQLEHQIRFSNLHERRANIIAEVYKLLVSYHVSSAIFVSPASWGGQPSKAAQLQQARSEARAFYMYFDLNKIWLPAAACKQVELFIEDIRSNVETLGVYEPLIENQSIPQHVREDHSRLLRQASVRFSEEIPKAKELLEAELRRLLGDTP